MLIPADVLRNEQSIYTENYKSITKNSDRLMLFSADQKIEHLNSDFYGSFIHPEVNHPEHLFKIASQGRIGAFATQLGLIARYGHIYNNIHYIVKLNSKTNLIPLEQNDPNSSELWNIEDVIKFKNNSNLKIVGIGYTIYLGSEYENEMLQHAAKNINKAHQHGLIAILWVYPRGRSLKNKNNLELISGATGLANALGADFVKINPYEDHDSMSNIEVLKVATIAAGNTKVICSGGPSRPTEIFLKELYEQINFGGTAGNATGRNIFQRSLFDAIAFTHAISAIVYDNKTFEEALYIYEGFLNNR